jgi:hypothetical protein
MAESKRARGPATIAARIAAHWPGRRRLKTARPFAASLGIEITPELGLLVREAAAEIDRVRRERNSLRSVGWDRLATRRSGHALTQWRATQSAAIESRKEMEKRARDEVARRQASEAIGELLARPMAQSRHVRRARRALTMLALYEPAELWRLRASLLVELIAHALKFRRARAKRWLQAHRSQSSIYLVRGDIRLRISDHDLPMHAEREYNHSQGWRCCDVEIVFGGRETLPEALRLTVEALRAASQKRGYPIASLVRGDVNVLAAGE